MLDFDPYDSTDTFGKFPLFQRSADVISSRQSVVFWRFVRLGSFRASWRQENITPIPKGPPITDKFP